MQAEAAAKEKKEREAKDAEGKKTQSDTTTNAKVEAQNQDQDVEMEPPTTTIVIPAPTEDSTTKLETPLSPPGLSLSPIPSLAVTSVHPSLPPKPTGSRSGTPVSKVESVPSTHLGTGGTTASAVSEPPPSTTTPLALPNPTPTAVPALPPLPRDEQINRAEEVRPKFLIFILILILSLPYRPNTEYPGSPSAPHATHLTVI